MKEMHRGDCGTLKTALESLAPQMYSANNNVDKPSETFYVDNS